MTLPNGVTELSSYPYQRRITSHTRIFCPKSLGQAFQLAFGKLPSRPSGVELYWLRLRHLQYRLADFPHDVHFAALAIEFERNAILAVD